MWGLMWGYMKGGEGNVEENARHTKALPDKSGIQENADLSSRAMRMSARATLILAYAWLWATIVAISNPALLPASRPPGDY